LTRIAQTRYGDAEMWRAIYDANRNTIGVDPDRLEVGMRLRLPPA
jgi:nucleoid-associated protein YgaU